MQRQINVFVQVIAVYLSHIQCQQFTFNNNELPVPPRFLVPGTFSPPINRGPSQTATKLLQQGGREEETVQRLRQAAGRTRGGTLPPANLGPFETDHSSVSSIPSRISSSLSGESLPVPTRPAVEEDEENYTEDNNVGAFPFSTYEPNNINTATARTLRPVTQFRPTKAQYIIDENNHGTGSITDEFQATKAQQTYAVSQQLTTIEGNTAAPTSRRTSSPEVPRRQLITRTQNLRSSSAPQSHQQQQLQPQSQEIVENKISRTYDKLIKMKYDKPSNVEKRPRKPAVVAQVLRRYREDNPDGSITWGFENDDGSYKEETIGNDCVTRGKYGYIDPDGVRREYSYSQGLPCDKSKTEHSEEDDSPSGGYIDYSKNKVVLPNGDSVDLDNMVKNRARKPIKSKNS